MLRLATLAVGMTIAATMLNDGGAAVEPAARPHTRSDEYETRSGTRIDATNCSAANERPHRSASLTVVADDMQHLLLRAAGDSTSGTGNLIAYPLDPVSGELAPPLWDASLLPAASSRKIVTTNSDGRPVAFRWAALDDARRAQLRRDPAILEYLRGETTSGSAPLREQRGDRGSNLFGAIVASTPVLVGPPAFAYRDDLEGARYSTFSRQYRQRRSYVFVGAGDGMLHAIDAQTGIEAFAVLPGEIFSKIGSTQPSEAADAILDGSPSVGDAFVGGRWRTVLLTGLARGGRSIVALDVTDPAEYAALEEHPGRLFLWEFTDAELGLTYSRPVIARLHTGSWAAIFGNGHTTHADPVLYVLDLATGKIIRKLAAVRSVSGGANALELNGLSTPAAVDMDGDRIVEHVYAGDLRGTLWKFDLSSADSEAWKAQPLFEARTVHGQTQPIVLRPEVVRDAKGTGVLVLFAAGEDVRASPASDHATLYALADRDDGLVRHRKLLSARDLSSESQVASGMEAIHAVRALSIGAGTPADGWYVDFASADATHDAEQVLTAPAVRDATVNLMTWRASKNPCHAHGMLWTTSLDVFGAERPGSAFDVNLNGLVDSRDRLTIEVKGQTKPAAAIGLAAENSLNRSSSSIAMLENRAEDRACRRFFYVPQSAHATIKLTQSCDGPRGRQSWRQVR